MDAVKIKIPGAFWDSQIYSGEIILFTDGGGVRRFDWRQFIDSIADQHFKVMTALRIAFVDGELFYNEKVRKILLDPEVSRVIKSQLDGLASMDLWVSDNSREMGRETSSPFDFMPTDTDVYYNNVIASGDNGLFSCARGNIGKRSSGVFVEKHHDAKFIQVKASDRNTAVAAAAGDDGLLEFTFDREGSDARLAASKLLAQRPCSACDWAFQSVVGWTESDGFLANFREERQRGKTEKIRLFDRVINFSEFFDSSIDNQSKSFSWGAREKFYRISNGSISVVERSDSSKSRKKAMNESTGEFKIIDRIAANLDADSIVSTGTAPFGSVVELSDRILVIRSDGRMDTFHGELVHWRIFPRSSNYSNQLHLIYEDHMEVISFVHDYFVDQIDKRFGFYRSADPLSEEVKVAFS